MTWGNQQAAIPHTFPSNTVHNSDLFIYVVGHVLYMYGEVAFEMEIWMQIMTRTRVLHDQVRKTEVKPFSHPEEPLTQQCPFCDAFLWIYGPWIVLYIILIES